MNNQLLSFKFFLFFLLFSFSVQTGYSQVLYHLAGSDQNQFSVLDLKKQTREVLELHPRNIYDATNKFLQYNPDSTEIYVIENNWLPGPKFDGRIKIIDLETLEVKEIEGIKSPFYMGDEIFLGLQSHPIKPIIYLRKKSSIEVYNTVTLTSEASIPMPQNVEVFEMKVNESGDELLLCTSGAASLIDLNFRIVNTNTNTLETILPMDPLPKIDPYYSYKVTIDKSYISSITDKVYSVSKDLYDPRDILDGDLAIFSFNISDWSNITGSKVFDSKPTLNEDKYLRLSFRPDHGHYLRFYIDKKPNIEVGTGGITNPNDLDYFEFLKKIEVVDLESGNVLNTVTMNSGVYIPRIPENYDLGPDENKILLLTVNGDKHSYAVQSVDLMTGNIEELYQFSINEKIKQIAYQNLNKGIMILRGYSFTWWVNLNNESITDLRISIGHNEGLQAFLMDDRPSPSTVAYIPNQNDNTVSVIDVADDRRSAEAKVTIPVGVSPRTVAVSPNNSRVYVGNAGEETVSVIQAYTNTVIHTFSVSDKPLAIAVSKDNKKIVVSTSNRTTGTNPKIRVFDAISFEELANYSVGFDPDAITIASNGTIYVGSHDASNNGLVSVIDPAGVKQPDISLGSMSRPEGIAILEDGPDSKLYVAAGDSGPGVVIAISLSAPFTPTNIALAGNPRGMAIAPDGSYVYVVEQTTGDVRVIDTSVDALLTTTFATCPNAEGISISLDGTKLLVACTDNDLVKDIDIPTGTVVDISVGDKPRAYGNAVAGYTRAEYVTALHPTAYITNTNSNNVSVINTETYETVKTIWVGGHPEGIAISPDNKRAYVTNNESNSLTVINTTTNQVIKMIDVGEEPMGVCVHPDGSKIYVTNIGDHSIRPSFGSISVVDANTLTVTQTIPNVYNPYGICIDPAGWYIFVTNYYSGTVSVYDAESGAPHPTYPIITVQNEPCGIAMSRDEAFLYVANHGSNTVSIIDFYKSPPAPVVTHHFVGTSPIDLALSPDGSQVIISNEGSPFLSRIYTSNNNVESHAISADAGARGIAFSPHNSKMLVVGSQTNEVQVLDDHTYAKLENIPVGNNPESFGDFITNEELRAYIPIEGGNIHTSGYAVVAVVDTELEVMETYIHASASSTSLIKIHPDGDQVLVTPGSNVVYVISTLTNKKTGMYDVGLPIYDIEYSPDGSKLYVTIVGNHPPFVVDTQTGDIDFVNIFPYERMGNFSVHPDGNKLYGRKIGGDFDLLIFDRVAGTSNSISFAPNHMEEIVFHPTAEKAFVLLQNVNIIKIIDTSTDAIISGGDINVSGDVAAFTIHPDGSKLYYINKTDRKLYSIDLAAGNTETLIARVGANSKCLQISQDGNTMYVLDEGTENLFVVDLNEPLPVTARTVHLNGKAKGCGCFVRYPK